MKYIVALLFCFLLISSRAQKNELGFGLGFSSYTGDLKRKAYDFTTSKPVFNLHFRTHFAPSACLRFTLAYSGLKGNDDQPYDILGEIRKHDFSINILEYSSVFEYHFLDFTLNKKDRSWTPYLYAGIGLLHLLSPPENDHDYSNFQPVIPFGFGIKYKFSKNLILELETGARKTFFDYLDNVSEGDYALKNFQFGNPKDNDWYFFTCLRLSIVLFKIQCPYAYLPNKEMMMR